MTISDLSLSPDQIKAKIDKTIKSSLRYFKPPEKLTLSEWADKYRFLSPESSAEPGRWRTSRTPYLKRIMDCWTDPKVRLITAVAASQVGKSEVELNAIGYAIDQAPASIMYVHPNLKAAQKFSRLRVNPMIRDCKSIRDKVKKTKKAGNTILQKSFPGGMLTIVGSESASDLASTPARYVIGDERDRWAISAGREGDPWELLKARQITYFNSKTLEVSTPTIKDESPIAFGFMQGTQERWCTKCPHCGEYFNITWDNIRFNNSYKEINHKKVYTVTDIYCACPHCGGMTTENEMKLQPSKWIADNPEAYERGHVSFWLNAFVSPWQKWETIILKFLEAKDNPEKLQVVFNTQLGELWENRGDLQTEDEMLARRETYEAELPDGVLALTCGVDTQDDRLEYEIVGYGFFNEKWGIRKGIILGRPDRNEVWKALDEVIDRVYEQCRLRQFKRVFAIKGKGGQDVPYISQKPSKVVINGNNKRHAWLYVIGVDAGKTAIMSDLRVETPGANYCHFPNDDAMGYDMTFFNGLLSEKLTLNRTKTGNRWVWEKIPGHQRNEPLDCRNYANAAYRVWNPDLDRIFQRLKNPAPKPVNKQVQKRKKKKTGMSLYSSEW